MEEELLCEGEINREADMSMAMELLSMHPLEKSIAPAVGLHDLGEVYQNIRNLRFNMSDETSGPSFSDAIRAESSLVQMELQAMLVMIRC
ncbi:hypothetical protein M5K25_008730 [Dendrobium thyrsiflorum]|uniref:Uncharacterized protein n=1 Tax=Dendrobium thyrsiflorum TaxID=117978 RepID=A0ABD0VGI4_DENTH